MQRYNWAAMLNTRDLGYTPTVNGIYVKPRRFIRSDAPLAVTDDEKAFLIEHGIRTVIDLRNEKIAGINPNAFVSDSRFFCYNFSLSIGVKTPASENDIVENNCRMLENDGAVAGIFKTMASALGGVLFHCQEGKDRTGIISALLLLLAGVSDIDIYADYEISNIYLYEMIKTAQAVLPEYLLYVKPEYMEKTLKYLREKYQTAENYLLSKGLSEIEIQKLKGKLLE